MSLKKIIAGEDSLLRLLLALIFISAGLFRIFNSAAATTELARLNLPAFFTWFILIIEIGGGLLLLCGKFVKQVSIIFILFLIFALTTALVVNGHNIISQAGELFVFDAVPTDFFLHFVFLIILVYLFRGKKE
jgi:uncharacterized membrane protein YphA (DoxX/SURF4 family)